MAGLIAEPPLGAGPRAQPAWKREILERKRAKLAGAAGGEPEPSAGERLVVAESLGPLRENPFMRLESERRRLRAVPGIRTIRADNILIIESQPDAAACFAEGVPPEAAEPGTVSRLLEKFGQRPRGRRRRGGEAGPASPQPLPAPPRAATPPAVPAAPHPAVLQPAPPRAAPPQPAAPQPLPAPPQAAPAPPRAAAPQAVPTAPKAAAPQANCFLHKIGSNSFTVTPRGLPLGSRVPEPGTVPAGRPVPPKGPPVPSASASRARANARRPKPEEAEVAESPLPSASLAPSATGSTQPLSASAPRAGGSFEIHPAPKPDLAAIPAHDLQAQALAKLRLNSRNSFLFVPRREGGPVLPPAQSARPGPPPPSSEEKALKEPLRASTPEQEEPVASPLAPLDPLVPVTYIDDIVEPDSGELSPRAGSAVRTGNLADQPGGAGDLEMEFSSVPLYRPHSAPHQRGGSTFTVVPKRKPVASGLQSFTDASGRPQREEEEEEEEESKGKGKAVDSTDGPQVGMSHKKRYPTVNEIEVIGGYLSLERSCMIKTGSRRKKMKISFNETSLQTMFEYPSESSLAEEEEEEEGPASETEEDKSRTFYIPRPNSTLHPNTPNSGERADLSSYTPKHSVKFSEWQEQKYEETPAAEGPLPKELTPAEKGGLSDFSSEPALYF
uniref:Taperin n=1 Tax=Accipiter nisus TaxID=211598 RepID=A0A8B9N782_9AVES